MTDTTWPCPDRRLADTGAAARALADNIGEDHATRMINAGADLLGDLYPQDDRDRRDVAAVVLYAAMTGFTRDQIETGLLMGARAAIADAELGAVAETIRAVHRALVAEPDTPGVEVLAAFAGAAGVDLAGGPATLPGPDDDDVAALAGIIAGARAAGSDDGHGYLARAILNAGYRQTGARP